MDDHNCGENAALLPLRGKEQNGMKWCRN